MLRSLAVLACTLVFYAQCESPTGNKLRGKLLPDGQAADVHSENATEVRHVDIEHHARTAAEALEDATSAHYCGCNASTCNVDTAKIKNDLQTDLVVIFGCSLDINALEHFCNAVGAPVQNFETRNPFSYLAHCHVGEFTVAYVFHPGASPPPYFADYAGTATTKTVMQNAVHDIQLQFGKQPSAIVVDSSLWDVSNWWEKHGRPAQPYPMPTADINSWCHRSVPTLLEWAQAMYPHSGVAFRTPPTVFQDNGYGQSPVIIDEMVNCIEGQRDPLGRLYGRFGMVDYHNFVDEVLQHSQGPPMQTWYKDSLHPGPALSMMYMNRVLNWVRSLKPLHTMHA